MDHVDLVAASANVCLAILVNPFLKIQTINTITAREIDNANEFDRETEY